MAQIFLLEIFEYADSEIKSALRATLNQHFPVRNYASDSIFRTLKRMISRKSEYCITVQSGYKALIFILLKYIVVQIRLPKTFS